MKTKKYFGRVKMVLGVLKCNSSTLVESEGASCT